MKNYQIPFDEQGNLYNYTGYVSPIWKDCFEFEGTMVYENYDRGRSSVLINLRDKETNNLYPMFISEFSKLMKSNYASIGANGRIEFSGKWTFIKKGQNYSICIA